jgi:hypothetical protein
MNVLSIDIGIHHLGISVSCLNLDYTFREIIHVDNIDITEYTHKKVSAKDCTLYHTKTFCDWIDHVIQENRSIFEDADVILIERQPPFGFVAVEQLLFKMYRHKTYLIHPRNVHTYLNIGFYDYETRKVYCDKICRRFLTETLTEQLKTYDRSHDIADSICMMLYWRSKKETEYRREQHRKICDKKFKDVFEKLESFRYVR